MNTSTEQSRLEQARVAEIPWRKWGPYLSERQWGTVREDYSESGDAWNYFNHDHSRSRAYRWGEDGLAGYSDERQRMCFALALWNGADPIVKERLFGLTNGEGNHGEDVKEYYFYLDSTPTHSYMKYLYKYPHKAYPYNDLVRTNQSRGRHEFEYELLDTGVFAEDRYFDVFVEYAKASPDDTLVRVTVHNRGPEAATLHVLPTLWFRNTWAAGSGERPIVRAVDSGRSTTVSAEHPELGTYRLNADGAPTFLFTENETNTQRLFGAQNATPYVKDGINDFVVHGHTDAVNPKRRGTKVAAHYTATIAAGKSQTFRLRLTDDAKVTKPFAGFDELVETRRREADEFYEAILPAALTPDAKAVARQALAGMLWTKQYYYYDVDRWLCERGGGPHHIARSAPRNGHWQHMCNADIISMPDKWEYPWYAAWDLAFHVLALTEVDMEFAKGQLDLMLDTKYLHPSGQLPAYEWNFGDVNPPVHAWATYFTYQMEAQRTGQGDLDWLERSFQKLLLNFTWWVNRKDRSGNNVFEGGFLGLDNIGVFDRSAPLPTGGYLDQADGTAWMAMFCQNMLQMSAELALTKPAYAPMAQKFVEHFLWIATSMLHAGNDTGMWDEEDGFFYDVLQLPDGRAERLKVRSLVGILPLCAVTVFDGRLARARPEVAARFRSFLESHPELTLFIHDPAAPGVNGRHMASILDEKKLRRVLAKLLDEEEFLSPHGIRSLSKFHEHHPYVYRVGDREHSVSYLPAESDSGMFGGNSNWRGPVWMPVNALIIRALLQYHSFFGEDLTVECPTGSGRHMTLYQVAEELARRLSALFLRDAGGRRPAHGDNATFQQDPHWRDLVLFYEYFHGDNGAGLGASHQTGWTGIVARIMELFASGALATRFDATPRPAAGRIADIAESPART